MALTLEAEQRLEAAELIDLYTDHEQTWRDACQETKSYVGTNFPPGALIRRDDVAKAFVTILEVNETLRTHLDGNKLRQKFWVRMFADLIIDRCWDELE
jgi:hypothetical protein